MVVVNGGTKHCPVDTRDDVLYSLCSRTQTEINILKHDWKDQLPVIVGSVQLALTVVRVDVFVCDDSYDSLTVLQPLPYGAVPITPRANVLCIQPYRQPTKVTVYYV